MPRIAVVALALNASALFAQTPAAFDVASIRPSQGGDRAANMQAALGHAARISPDGVILRNVTLRTLTSWAYHVLEFQVTGPDWAGVNRFDVSAKAAGPVSEDELRTMMQALLADRFKMSIHRDTKETSAYVLQVAKGGLKIKESTSEGEADIQPNQQRMSVSIQRTGMPELVAILGNVFRAPIVDQTGIKGRYDATIDVAKYMADMRPSEGGAPPDPIAIVTRGLQEEFGIKVEAKKMPVDFVVIDRADKTPVAN